MTRRSEANPDETRAAQAKAQQAPRPWDAPIQAHPAFGRICQRLTTHRKAWAYAHGGTGSAATLATAAVTRRLERPALVVAAHMDDVDEAVDELRGVGLQALALPALETLPGESNVSPELVADRLAVLDALKRGRDSKGKGDEVRPRSIIVTSIAALMQSIPNEVGLERLACTVRCGDKPGIERIAAWLTEGGYVRVESVEAQGEFSIRGGTIDIFLAAGTGSAAGSEAREQIGAVRLDFFDEEVESITEIDPESLAADRKLRSVHIVANRLEDLLRDEDSTGLWSLLPEETVVVLLDLLEVTEQGRGYYERLTRAAGVYGPPAVLKALSKFTFLQIDHHAIAATDPDGSFELPFAPLPTFAQDVGEAVKELRAAEDPVQLLCVNAAERTRLTELLTTSGDPDDPTAPALPEHVRLVEAYLHRGFVYEAPPGAARGNERIWFLPSHELLHRYHVRRRATKLKSSRAIDTFLDLAPGEYVVHRDHGIARFVGLQTLAPSTDRIGQTKGMKNVPQEEFLTLEFAGGAKLHVPAVKIDLIQKYVGGFEGKPPLSTLGGKRWDQQKEQVAGAVKDLAAEMLRIQAVREHLPGIRYPHDTLWQKQFEAEFPYEETPDQLAALSEIKKDMLQEKPMDRLICGDVGFGKTELAIRAAFKAAEFGKQTAVLVPTTVLAEQHYRTFTQRYADYPFRVGVISRFQTNAEAKETLARLKRGEVDILIGTHRLLSQDVQFSDLGLVIIDEEQRFGVEHKNRLLQFRMTADVLTLSATPIPRTLHMSLLGIRDISSLTTPPADRRAIVTEVSPYNAARIKQAIQRELAREGQVYFVHNRVHNIKSVADDIHQLVPDARILIGHGQMPDGELEDVMVKFIRREADILVSTTIIESGIDIPTANTILINNADKFGLADLHQLRGRVGRSKHRAYCYLLLSPDRTLTEVASKRLKAVEQYSMLGAGFKIAMRDMEIRGAGNLLGKEQSGHIAVVGYEMYCHLLENAVRGLKQEKVVEPIETEVEVGLTGSIPKTYIASDMRRMEAYRRISAAKAMEELNTVAGQLKEAYGEWPSMTKTLLQLAEIRIRAAHLGIKSITRHEADLVFRTENRDVLLSALRNAPGPVRVIDRPAPKSVRDQRWIKEKALPAPPMPALDEDGEVVVSAPAEVKPADQEPAAQTEVYVRLGAEYWEGATLLAFLRKRLSGG